MNGPRDFPGVWLSVSIDIMPKLPPLTPCSSNLSFNSQLEQEYLYRFCCDVEVRKFSTCKKTLFNSLEIESFTTGLKVTNLN